MPLDLLILTPIYNDWDCFSQLLSDIERKVEEADRISIIGINDCSITPQPELPIGDIQPNRIKSIELINLACNIGHQRAIAVGLASVSKSLQSDAIAVIDCDGEDRPEDLNTLIQEWKKNPQFITVAQRSKRGEGILFRILYFIYRLVFRITTGVSISFGNFSVSSLESIQQLIIMPDIWNHFAASILKSKIPLNYVPTQRGKRYFGKSRMNMIDLLRHGFSAISVFIEFACVRMVVFSAVMSMCSLLGAMVIIYIRIFTDLAIPGWASYLMISFIIIFLQSLLISMIAVLLALHNRSNIQLYINQLHADSFILNRRSLYP